MIRTSQRLKGRLVLDGGRLRGSFFQRAVVMICQQNARGTIGFMLNRLNGARAGDTFGTELPQSLTEYPVYIGGPMEPSQLGFLFSDAFLGETNLLPDLRWGFSLEELIGITEFLSATQQVKLFAGYTGWCPGQLEEEIRHKGWLVHPASLDLLFDSDAQQLWQKILRQKGWRNRLLATMPEDLRWN